MRGVLRTAASSAIHTIDYRADEMPRPSDPDVPRFLIDLTDIPQSA
ncbi:hypothetical protein ABZU32_06215 [Sphaerisporangium sp. NPDC005288]